MLRKISEHLCLLKEGEQSVQQTLSAIKQLVRGAVGENEYIRYAEKQVLQIILQDVTADTDIELKYWDPAERERYRRYLNSDAWKAKRAAVLKAAGGKCRRCGALATEVHHETYDRVFNERLSDLTALCRECHEKEHLNSKLLL